MPNLSVPLRDHLATVLGLPCGSFTSHEVKSRLTAFRWEAARKAILCALERCDAARFAPGITSVIDGEAELKQFLIALRQIDRLLATGTSGEILLLPCSLTKTPINE